MRKRSLSSSSRTCSPGATGAPWLKAEFSDKDGMTWKELDVPRLVQDPVFLEVAA